MYGTFVLLRCRSNSPGRRALTLIEVLVVLAVAAVLVGLLVPVMGQARAAGRASKCLGTLHGSAMAVSLYVDDNDGRFWPYFTDVPGPEGGRRWWFGFEPGGPSYDPRQRHRPLVKDAGYIGRYMSATADDLMCPSFPYPAPAYFPRFRPAAGGYGYNAAALGGFGFLSPSNAASNSINAFAGRTSDVFVLADGLHFDRLDFSSTPPLAQGFNEPFYIEWQDPELMASNAGVNGGFGHFRHNGAANVLYLDGHAAGQPVRGRRHPYSHQGYGPVANLSDDTGRVAAVQRGRRTFMIDLIYGLR